MAEHEEKDRLSGIETTGHEWDGIKELNNPLPRWWLWVFYLTIIWSIGYWVLYPAWPTFFADAERGGSKGTLGWTQYSELEEQQAEIVARRGAYLKRFHDASFEQIIDDPELYAFALAGGRAAFKDNCATCHGTGGAGAEGYPNLNDDDWIWAGDFEGIYETIKYGIRLHEDGRDSLMPDYEGVLSSEEIASVAAYVQGLHSGQSTRYPEDLTAERIAALPLGARVFHENCTVCHGVDGKGDRALGAPNLADAIWLKSEDGSVEAIISQIKYPQHGMMPAWVDRLDDDTIRQLTIYVHELGGGE